MMIKLFVDVREGIFLWSNVKGSLSFEGLHFKWEFFDFLA